MKKIIFRFLTMCALSTFLLACSKEKRAFNDAINSREINQLRLFLTQYPKADSVLVDSAKMILAKWESDSIDYISLKKIKNVEERYLAESTYMEKHLDGLYFESVYQMYQNDAVEAVAIIAKREAIQQHLSEYRDRIENKVFYQSDVNNNKWILTLTPPDKEGKGKGLSTTYIKSLGMYMYTGTFTYYIDLENFKDDKIYCKYNKTKANFTLEIYDDRLWFKKQGNVESFIGEMDKEYYQALLKSIKELEKDEK